MLVLYPPEPVRHASCTTYIHRLLAHSARSRLPQLLTQPRSNTLYHLPNRHGVSVVALRPAASAPTN